MAPKSAPDRSLVEALSLPGLDPNPKQTQADNGGTAGARRPYLGEETTKISSHTPPPLPR